MVPMKPMTMKMAIRMMRSMIIDRIEDTPGGQVPPTCCDRHDLDQS